MSRFITSDSFRSTVRLPLVLRRQTVQPIQEEVSVAVASLSLTPKQEFGRAQYHAIINLGFYPDEAQRIINAGMVAVAAWAVECAIELARDGYSKDEIFRGIEMTRKSIVPPVTFEEYFPDWEIPRKFTAPEFLFAFLDSMEEALKIGLPMDLVTEDNEEDFAEV